MAIVIINAKCRALNAKSGSDKLGFMGDDALHYKTVGDGALDVPFKSASSSTTAWSPFPCLGEG